MSSDVESGGDTGSKGGGKGDSGGGGDTGDFSPVDYGGGGGGGSNYSAGGNLITPAAKADMINRVEIVARGVSRARSRANNVTIDNPRTIGAALFNYILG